MYRPNPRGTPVIPALFLFVLGLTIAGPGPVAAAAEPMLTPANIMPGVGTFKDPATDIEFPSTVSITTADGRRIDMKALGSGVRKKVVFKVYAAALYVDSSLDLGRDPAVPLVRDDIARRLVMKFVRDVDEEKIHEAYQEGLVDKVWKAQPPPELDADLHRFLGFFAGGIKDGQTIELTYIPGEGLYTTVAGTPKPVTTNPKIAHDIWAVWLGDEPVSDSLKKGLTRLYRAGNPGAGD